mgnify:CR=1 FL=1
MRNKFRDGLMSIWGHTEMELLPLTKSELLGKMAEISNIVNDLVDLDLEGECSHCGDVYICEPCLDEMCTATAL